MTWQERQNLVDSARSICSENPVHAAMTGSAKKAMNASDLAFAGAREVDAKADEQGDQRRPDAEQHDDDGSRHDVRRWLFREAAIISRPGL